MKKKTKLYALLVLAGIILAGCSSGAIYERRLKKELASGVRNDSLFMGIYLGMTSQDFYSHCWHLNRDGLVKQGTHNLSVEYAIREELNHPAVMNFYPEFHEDKIAEMPVRFIYTGWSPWNKSLSSDSLQMDVKNWYEKEYGKGFITITHPEKGSAYVKINGNRRITIYREDDKQVWAVFTDMLVYRELNDSTHHAEDTISNENSK